MDKNPDSIDLDTLSGIPSEQVFEKLLSDPTFVDYLNTFLSLPVFGKRLSYNRADDNFSIDPPPPRTCYHLPVDRIKKWVRTERMPFFWRTDLFLEYLLCVQLHNATDSSSATVDISEARTFLRTVEDICNFHLFLRGTAGKRMLMFWIDAERYRRVTKKEHRRFSFREIQAKYLRSGSPRELPEIMKWASLCGGSPQGERKSSFRIPKSITKRMYLSDSSIFSENAFIPGQKMALERLSGYWVPKFIQHKKIIRKLIAEKRGVCADLKAQNRSIFPIPELDKEVSRTSSEQEIDDFMEAQCVSSSESITITDEEIRQQKLEEWKSWFWAEIDSQTGSEHKMEPLKDMPLELRQLGGITGDDKNSSAPPSSPVSGEEEEDDYLSSWSGAESHVKGYSISFSHAPRHRLISSPVDKSDSDPALPTYGKGRWFKSKGSNKEEDESENADPQEETLFTLPRLHPPYAQIPLSGPRKLKTLYEALASERSTITEEQDEELYESSSESTSANRSLSGTPPPTVISALRRASASRVIPFEDPGHEIASAVGEPRAVYPRDSKGEQFIIPSSDVDMNLSNESHSSALVALTADKLAGGPLREYLEKTQAETALRSLQFWEDAQRYLSLQEEFGSYGKYHSAKTLIATYIAPDSPRKMDMSPQIRADLMQLLPQERGDHLLSSVIKASVQTVALLLSEFIHSDEDHFVNSVGVRRKSANKNMQVEPDETPDRSRTTDYSNTWHAFTLAVGIGLSGFSFGQEEEDKDELEAREENFQIPSLKDQQEMENYGSRNRRASHFYGQVTREGGETSEGKGKNMGNKIRPPKPRCFNDVLHDTLQLMWFKRFLSDKQCEAPLLFWQAVENMKTNCKDGKARQAKAMIITKKYFINIPTSSAEYLHCKADLIKDIPLMDKATPPMLVSAQACVARSMEENWYADYVATFPEDETERENFTRYAMRNTLAGVYKMAAHGKTKGLWVMFAHNIMCFQRGIHNPDSLREFKAFLKKESKATVEHNLRRHSVHPTRRMINNQFVNTDRLVSDLEFWMEVERFKDQADNAAECARSGNYTLEDENLLLDKARTIVKCFIDSDFPPRIQINVANDLAENVVGLVSTGIVERGLFHEAALQVFTPLMFLWKKYSAELISQPTEEAKPPSPAKKGASARKRIMSIVGGMPYRKIYTAQDEELHWSFSLSHGLRLTMPLKFVMAKRVATQMGRRSNHASKVSLRGHTP